MGKKLGNWKRVCLHNMGGSNTRALSWGSGAPLGAPAWGECTHTGTSFTTKAEKVLRYCLQCLCCSIPMCVKYSYLMMVHFHLGEERIWDDHTDLISCCEVILGFMDILRGWRKHHEMIHQDEMLERVLAILENE
jgi:hypothetical protein